MSTVFTWNKLSKDGHAFRMLLQHMQFQALSIENLLRLGRATLSGLSGGDLHREVDDALASRKRIQSPATFQSKTRRGIASSTGRHGKGASTSIEASGREVLPLPYCAGTKVNFLLHTSIARAPSFVGSLETLQHACDVLGVKVPLWLASMTWEPVIAWPSREKQGDVHVRSEE